MNKDKSPMPEKRKVAWGFCFFLLIFAADGLLCGCRRGNVQQLDRLLSEIDQMDSCRRRAENRNFYLHKYEADKVFLEYTDRYSSFSEEEQQKYLKARCRYSYTLSDYYQQVGNLGEAYRVIDELASDATLNLVSDTTEWLDFLCHVARVSFHPYNIKKYRSDILRGYDCLSQCYFITQRTEGFGKYRAVSMMLLSKYLANPEIYRLAQKFDPAFLRYINENTVSAELLPGNLAERAVVVATTTGDEYLLASAWLNLSQCFFDIGNAQRSLECLNQAMSLPQVAHAPDLLASISEQMSLSHSALNQKQFSDYYRNKYLDLQDSTRQDRQLEARVEALNNSTTRIWTLFILLAIVFVLLGLITAALVAVRRRNARRMSESESEIEEIQDKISMLNLQHSQAVRSAVEQQARIQMANAMVPLIDRMYLIAGNSERQNSISSSQAKYISELAINIEQQNAMLTQWIKLKQGVISPRIENVSLNEVFDVVATRKNAIASKGITLTMTETDIVVKADRALTLFIINTLVDNAVQAIENDSVHNRSVNVGAIGNPDGGYAEITVADDGPGMNEWQVEHLFDYKTIIEKSDEHNVVGHTHHSHGFGMQNCRGIIDRYRKISSLFSVCDIYAKSTKGQGSSISFRLPQVLRILIVILAITVNASNMHATASSEDIARIKHLDVAAARYCDSLYNCNISGRYDQALLFADSCKACVTASTDTTVILSLYNETAVAALALHKWNLYHYNNYLYTSLFKKATRDATLSTYCQTMERNNYIANIAVLVIVLLIVLLIPVFVLVYLRPLFLFRRNLQNRKVELREKEVQLQREVDRLHIQNNITSNQLSVLKHETMYYPARIKSLTDSSNVALYDELSDTVRAYRELYIALSNRVLSDQGNRYVFPPRRIPLSAIVPEIDDDRSVFANAELIDYLKLLLKRRNGGRTPEAKLSAHQGLSASKYVSIVYAMTDMVLPPAGVSTLFSSTTPDVEYLIIRQIIRETGSAAHAYACGVKAEVSEGIPCITIVLPLAN